MARRKIEDEDDDCVSGPFEVTVHRWARDPWPTKLQKILDGLEIGALDEGARLFLQRQLHIGGLFDQDRTGHVVLTLRCIVESEGNDGALSEMMLRAVSGVIGPYEDRGLELVEAFDQIPLLGVLEQMRALEYFYVNEATSALERILKHKLRRMLISQPAAPAPRLSKKERIAAHREATAAANLKIVEQRLDLGRKLAALRDVTPRNTTFGQIVRHKFDLHNPAEVAAMIRAATLYGERPDIIAKVRNWRTLVALTSTLLSEPARLEWEARILAGENVMGTEIARKASRRGKTGRPSTCARILKSGRLRGPLKSLRRRGSPEGN